MRKAYKMEDVCCAACASKIEDGISKLDGVNKATVNFMTSKLILDVDDASKLDSILDQAQKIVTKYEADALIVR